MKVFKMCPEARAPEKRDEDMCYDLFSVGSPVLVKPGRVAKVSTGLKLDLEGYHASLRPRSGLASKCGLQVLGGQIDKGYRGEIIIMLTSEVPTRIEPGDKVCQMKLEEDITVQVIEVESEEELSNSVRQEDGFGSTGD